MTTETTTPIPEPPAPRRLTRSSDDRVIGGVAGGIGRYLGLDPVLVRIAFVVLVFFGGAGLIAYGAGWLLMPSDTAGPEATGRRATARRAGAVLGILVLSFALAIGGGAAAAAGGGKAVAITIVVVGVLLAIAGIAGDRRARWLIVPALALALPAGVVAAADVDGRGGVGEKVYRPLSQSDLRSNYRLGMGHLVVDLRDARLDPGEHRIHLKLGVGGAEVLVPPNACVSSLAHIGVGGTEVFDRNSGGVDVDWEYRRTAPSDTPHVIIDADIGIGGLRVEPAQNGNYPGNEACE